jgi:ATP synthase protein I
MTSAPQAGQPGPRPAAADRVMRRGLATTVALGLVLAGTAQVLAGPAALAGVLAGTVLVCAFFGVGTLVLSWVTRVSPAMSLLVGLMTYTLQVVVLGLTFLALQASGLMRSAIDGTWLGGTVIAGTLVWLAIQVTLSLRTRQTYFDEPAVDPSAEGPGATGAGAR